MIKRIISYFILLKASHYQGKANFEKAISLAEKAKRFDPTSIMVFIILGDDYQQIKRYETAIIVLEEGLLHHPNDPQLNQLIVDAKVANCEPIANYIPYIKVYLKNHIDTSDVDITSNFIFKFMNFILPNKVDIYQYFGGLQKEKNDWKIWAKSILENHHSL